MDAATLYTVIAVASGPKRMTTEKFPTMTHLREGGREAAQAGVAEHGDVLLRETQG